MDERERTHRPRELDSRAPREREPQFPEALTRTDTAAQKTRVEQIYERVRGERDKELSRNRWGKVLIVIGVVTLLDWCAPIPIPLVGPPAIVVGLALIIAGGALLYRGPRMKGTNQAIMVAMKYGNQLSVPRLAVEMDVSLEEAEEIIDTLVKKGIAEIDLDAKDPDSGIIYKVKGI